MESTILSLLVFSSFSIFYATVTSAAGTGTTSSTSFIQASCLATTYPSVCVQSLSGYASTIQRSHRQLAHTALSVSLERAQSSRAFVKKLTKFKGLKPREQEAIQDCLEELADGVDRIGQSVEELKTMGGRGQRQDFFWHMSNVQTWLSAALTDDSTCMDGFSDKGFNPRIKASIKTRVTHVVQVTSNALALINHFAAHF